MTITLDLESIGYIFLALLVAGLIIGVIGSIVALGTGGFVTTYKIEGFASTGLCHVVHTTSVSGWVESAWEGEPSQLSFAISRSNGKVTYGYDSEEYHPGSIFSTNIKRDFYEALIIKVKNIAKANQMTRVTVEFSLPNEFNLPNVGSHVEEVSYILREDNVTWHDAETWYELKDRGADNVLREKLDMAYRKWLANVSFKEVDDETPSPEIDSREED